MSLKLDILPLELFGPLSEFLFANEVCWLWLSGSKRIHYLLEHGVTSFRHLPAQRRSYLWPSFISRFKRLQMASVASQSSWNTPELFHDIVLSAIPNSITSLKLRFGNGILALLQPPSKDVTSSDTVRSAMPLSTMFPNLAHLDVYSSLELDKMKVSSFEPILALPLSTLHLSLANSFPAALLKYLSPTLLNLKLSLMVGDADYFPPHLVVLSLDNFDGCLNASILPISLRRFTLHCKSRASMEWRNWPNELEFLSISSPAVSVSLSDIKSLPNTLQSLNMMIKSLEFASLHDLPQKLTFLSINGVQSLSAVSEEQWSQFEPKRLPPGLVGGYIDYLFLHTPPERLNTFPIRIRPAQAIISHIKACIVPSYVYAMADRLDSLSWNRPEPEMSWSFKNLKTLNFGEHVHPGQLFLTLPLLPLLVQLQHSRFIEDPSLALNRIISPYLIQLRLNCHPLSLCKWDKRWFASVSILELKFDPDCGPKNDFLDLLDSTGPHLDESACNDILAMDHADFENWKAYGGTKEDGTAPIINWTLFAPLLPRSLIRLGMGKCEPMDDPSSLVSISKCAWPPRLEFLFSFVPPSFWNTLPQSLENFSTRVESSNLVELAKNLKQLPKFVESISITFAHPTVVDPNQDLPTFTKLLQKRPHILVLRIAKAEMTLRATSDIDLLTTAIEAAFGPQP